MEKSSAEKKIAPCVRTQPRSLRWSQRTILYTRQIVVRSKYSIREFRQCLANVRAG